MLSLESISKTFNKGTVNEMDIFKNFSIHVKEGDFVSVIGSNGAGKSTLMNLVSGNIMPDKGIIKLKGKDITMYKDYNRGKLIGRVYQDPTKGTSPSMTIMENLSMSYNKGKSFGLGFCVKKDKEKYFKEELSVLNLGLENMLHSKVGLLSGGQRQALSLLMATMVKPDLLLLDEHTAALDPNTAENIIKLTESIIKEKGITTMMITHNLSHAVTYGNRLILMHKGNIEIDLEGEAKKNLTVENLIEQFKNIASHNELKDSMLLA
ncbi:ABC transporter ATP-binding protein [Clostridium amazonitimonense]|uniref:ABC transporter ATP-binding protein n=1 Tax=Clostridium amazonitimonense TaxID=1499689 RepID=UPI000509F2D4|nr:ATP-binding cassette domain-containing protein [Clostridium amazonitimonense]